METLSKESTTTNEAKTVNALFTNSPWGQIVHIEELHHGIRWVKATNGEGIVISPTLANKVFPQCLMLKIRCVDRIFYVKMDDPNMEEIINHLIDKLPQVAEVVIKEKVKSLSNQIEDR